MAKKKKAKKNLWNSCLLKFGLAWFCFLCVWLLYLHRSLGPTSPENQLDEFGDAMSMTNEEGEKKRSSLLRGGGKSPALSGEGPAYGASIPTAEPDLDGLYDSATADSAVMASKTSPESSFADTRSSSMAQDGKENNAPFPGKRPGDTDVRSTISELPNVSPGHFHGLLGLLPDGSERIPPTPLPPQGLNDAEHRDAHRGFCFNSRMSDSIALDRPQRDVRSQACKSREREYPHELPKASVIMVFHNENLSALLRSVHSVLNHTPSRLLTEIILVDDASTADAERFYQSHWEKLQAPLTEYCMSLPKVHLVRLKERRGLMMARMEGVWRATGDAIVFLDSHIECTPGWLEPLLDRIHKSKLHVVTPAIDSIDNDNFEYFEGGGLGVLSFSWQLGQVQETADNGPDGTHPAKSPVMAGGLFASDRKQFLKLGGYDPEMQLYGGEEMEIGFRTWMCGGDIEYVPCSHVGHIFRNAKWWQGQVYKVPGEVITRNKLRTAEVWMDDYKELVKIASAVLPPDYPLGSVEGRQDLRRKLHCHDFNWYLTRVTPNLFVPKLGPGSHSGALKNGNHDACIDTLGSTGVDQEIGVYPCHGQHGTQGILLDSAGLFRLPALMYQKCVGINNEQVVVKECDGNPWIKWKYDAETRQFRLKEVERCMEANDEPTAKSPYTLRMTTCEKGGWNLDQQWSFQT